MQGCIYTCPVTSVFWTLITKINSLTTGRVQAPVYVTHIRILGSSVDLILRFSSYEPSMLMDRHDVAQFGFVPCNVILIEWLIEGRGLFLKLTSHSGVPYKI